MMVAFPRYATLFALCLFVTYISLRDGFTLAVHEYGLSIHVTCAKLDDSSIGSLSREASNSYNCD